MDKLILCILLSSVGLNARIHQYLYAATAPACPSSGGADCSAYPASQGYINVYDINNGHSLVKTIRLPTTVRSIRGIFGHAGTNALYLANYGVTDTNNNTTSARLLRLNLTTDDTVYDVSYSLAAIDRACISSDGSTIYAPAGEGVQSDTYRSTWYVIRAADGTETGTISLSNGAIGPHNTICDTNTVYMGAIDVPGGDIGDHSVTVYNVIAGTQTTVGNFTAGTGRVRPFTADKPHGLVYVNLEDWIGFAVGRVSDGAVLYDSQAPPGYVQPGTTNVVQSHGIALTPNGDKLYVADPINRPSHGVEVWDVSSVRNGTAPTYLNFIPTATDLHVYDGRTPGWLAMSYDGRYLYPETGEVISTATDTVVGQLTDPGQSDGSGNMRTRFMMEVDFAGPFPILVGEQFGTGHCAFSFHRLMARVLPVCRDQR